ASRDGGGGYVAPGATLDIQAGDIGSEITHNGAVSMGPATTGGGIRNGGTTTISEVWIRTNSATNGAGIANVAGTLDLAGVTLSANVASGAGGGLHNLA